MRKARREANASLREICGIIVDNGVFLSLVETRNIRKRPLGFIIHGGDWNRIGRAAGALGWEFAGTFHSHVVSAPVPSRGDLAGAIEGHLMLILDASEHTFALWRIRRGKAFRLACRLYPAGAARTVREAPPRVKPGIIQPTG